MLCDSNSASQTYVRFCVRLNPELTGCANGSQITNKLTVNVTALELASVQ